MGRMRFEAYPERNGKYRRHSQEGWNHSAVKPADRQTYELHLALFELRKIAPGYAITRYSFFHDIYGTFICSWFRGLKSSFR